MTPPRGFPVLRRRLEGGSLRGESSESRSDVLPGFVPVTSPPCSPTRSPSGGPVGRDAGWKPWPDDDNVLAPRILIGIQSPRGLTGSRVATASESLVQATCDACPHRPLDAVSH